MASPGDNFTWTPGKVPPNPVPPQFAILETQSENFKKQVQLLDTNILEIFELDFGEILSTNDPRGNNRDDIRAHYIAQNHSYSTFSWTSVPSYISGSPITVRYQDYTENIMYYNVSGGFSIWRVSLKFRKEVS